ncbi:MAG: hypothetical protein LBE56_07210 [Tannerella sp.]|jgi:hypothetical protein|nr:hypothetical protein [Tannerella sp.]
MMRFKSYCIILLSAILWSTVYSQEHDGQWVHSITHRYLGPRDGLLQAQVFHSFQDSYGYIWFSTNEGVSRFDGLHFENFPIDELQTLSRVKYFTQYQSAVCMVTSTNIVFVYPDRRMEFYTLPDNYSIRDTEFEVAGNNLYLFNCYSPQSSQNESDLTLFRFDMETKTFTRLAEKLPLLVGYVFGETVYVISGATFQKGQITISRIEGDQLLHVQTIPMTKDFYGVSFCTTGSNELFAQIWRGTEFDNTSHLYECKLEGDNMKLIYKMQMDNLKIKCIERRDGHSLFAGKTIAVPAVSILDTEAKTASTFPLNMLIANDIMTDRDGNIWFSTEEGVYVCTRNLFESYQLGIGHNDNIWSVIKDHQGNVRFSSYMYGLWSVDPKGYIHKADIRYNGNNFSVWDGYMGNCIDGRGRVFQPTGVGIAVYDPKKGNPNRMDLLRTGTSLAAYYDQQTKNVYFGGDGAGYRILNILNENGELKSIQFGPRHIISICRDGHGVLRIGTFDGEDRLDEENQVVVHDTITRPYTGVIAMTADAQGNLWKATPQGLYVEDKMGIDRQISDNQVVGFVINYKNKYIVWGAKDVLYMLDLQQHTEGGG